MDIKDIKKDIVDSINQMMEGGWGGDTTPDYENPVFSIGVYGEDIEIVYYEDEDLLVVSGANEYSDSFHIAYPRDEWDNVEEIVDGFLADWEKYVEENKERFEEYWEQVRSTML